MALSGTLDSFALPDVLRLLASTKKTGRLRVTGDRGAGSVWFDDGQIVSTELTVVDSIDSTPPDVLFSLIRLDAGSFTFEADARVVNASEPDQLEPILVAAEGPALEKRLQSPLLTDKITIDPDATLTARRRGPRFQFRNQYLKT